MVKRSRAYSKRRVSMFIVDSHCDSVTTTHAAEKGIINVYNFSQRRKQLQFVAMFSGSPGESEEDCFGKLCRYTGIFDISMACESDKIIPVRTYADIERAAAEGKHAALLTVESATGMKKSPELLSRFYRAGVRVVGLTWLSNGLAKSNRVFDDGEEDTGLSKAGRAFVKAGNDLGMIWDVSHASDKTFWDLAELSEKPVIATHSNFRSLCSHSRNLTDDMALHIISSGGMIGLNLAPAFISDGEDRTVGHLFRHLDHCLELGGENNIGFGCDIDGIGSYPSPLTLERSIHDQLIDFMQKYYTERIVDKVAGENYLGYLKKYLN